MLKNFFGYVIDSENSVQFFEIHHYLYILAALCSFMIPYLYVRKETPWFSKRTIIIIVAFFVMFELYYHIQNFLFASITLPLHMSSLSLIMTIFLLVYPNNKRLLEITCYAGVSAGLTALLVPLSYGFPYYNFRYYHFLIVHSALIFFPLYVLKSRSYRFSPKAYQRVFVIVIGMIPAMYVINALLALLPYNFFHNYWFVYEIPNNVVGVLTYYPIYLGLLILSFYTLLLMLYFAYSKISKEVTPSYELDESSVFLESNH